MFKGKKIFVLGMARSGYSVAKLLSKDNQVLITDMSKQDEDNVKELISLGCSVVITDDPLELLTEDYDYVVKNPGIKREHPVVLKANKLNIPVINELEVSYHFLNKDVKIIGITGSNGKTTTTTIIYEILKNSKYNVHLAGNMGLPLSSMVSNIKKNDLLVIEISDHQLVDMYDFKTDISVFTNLTETHIDFHGTYDVYKNTKKKIFNNHTKDNVCILNKESNDLIELTKDIVDDKMYFSSKNIADCYIKDEAIYYKDELIIELDDIRIKGVHNYENIMSAIIVCKLLDVPNKIIKEELRDFGGVEHRIEFVKKINKREFYNDSKSTNTVSTITALTSFKNNVVLILGGLDRGHSFNPLNDYVSHVTNIVCYGETANRIKEWGDKLKIDTTIVKDLKEATILAYNISEENSTILFSPACASWDQFKDFEERGDYFKNIVNSIKEN